MNYRKQTKSQKPRKLKPGDICWAISQDGEICDVHWRHYIGYYACLKCGWLFRTEKEAEANRDRVLAEYEKMKSGELE